MVKCMSAGMDVDCLSDSIRDIANQIVIPRIFAMNSINRECSKVVVQRDIKVLSHAQIPTHWLPVSKENVDGILTSLLTSELQEFIHTTTRILQKRTVRESLKCRLIRVSVNYFVTRSLEPSLQGCCAALRHAQHEVVDFGNIVEWANVRIVKLIVTKQKSETIRIPTFDCRGADA